MGFIEYVVEAVMDSAIEGGLGIEDARKLAESAARDIRAEYGGSRPYVSTPRDRDRDRRIIEAKKNGAKNKDIAKRERVHKATVGRVLARGLASDDNWLL